MREDGQLERGDERDRARKIERLATLLIEQFGDRALEVSERQISLGDRDSVSSVWREISENIRIRNATG